MERLTKNRPSKELLDAWCGWLFGMQGYEAASSFHWAPPLGPHGEEIICVNGVRVFVSDSTIAAPGGRRGERLAGRTVTLPDGQSHTFYVEPK